VMEAKRLHPSSASDYEFSTTRVRSEQALCVSKDRGAWRSVATAPYHV
jgi:hypothetical protein